MFEHVRVETYLALDQAGRHRLAYPQTTSRMVPSSRRLYEAVTQGRIVHPDDPRLNEHIASAVAKHGPRGWRLDRADRPIDGCVALCMALDRAEHGEQPAKLLGWL